MKNIMLNLKDICNKLDIDCTVDKNIIGLNTLKESSSSEISFLENKKYISQLQDTKAAAVFVTEEFKDKIPSNTIALITPTPYISLALASKFFAPALLEGQIISITSK